jgi:hypothetical protein
MNNIIYTMSWLTGYDFVSELTSHLMTAVYAISLRAADIILGN